MMAWRLARIFTSGAVLLIALTVFTAGSQPAAADDCVTFSETGHQVCGRFLDYWRAHGGLAQQGLPLTEVFLEVNPTNGQTYPTQYFERARFEYHKENQPPYDVLLGLLGAEQYRVKYPTTPPPPFPGDPFNDPNLPQDCATIGAAGFPVCSVFLAYWQQHGGLEQEGLPLTGVILETNPTDGQTYPTQYFERARFEYHAEYAGTPYAVLLGLLGREQFLAKYPNGAPVGTTPPPPSLSTPTPTPAPPPPTATPVPPPAANCDPAYPTVCLPPPPPDLDCSQIPYRNFTVLPPDPHHLDSDHDGIGCES